MPRKPKAQAVPNTHVLIIADRSGSMSPLRQVVISQMNEFLQDRKNDPGKVTVSLFTFDTEFLTVFEEVPADQVPTITEKDYEPRGSTALFDAIARAVLALENKVGPKERALVNIVTDGYENASKEYALHMGGKAKIKELIERLTSKGNWTVTYASADINAFADALAIGIPVGNTNQFVASPAGFTANNAALRSSTAGYTQSGTKQVETFYNSGS